MKITFSHNYPKLHNQTSALLMSVKLINLKDLTEKFLEYDTSYYINGIGYHYPLKGEKFLCLIFLGNDLIPFTTVRSWNEEKEDFYKSNITKWFNIEYDIKD